MARLVLFNKPYGVLSQFSGGSGRGAGDTLADFIDCPEVYPAGRLDKDSEGLLLLTDDGRLQARIADPRYKLPKTYLVQVEGVPSEESLRRLRQGIELRDGTTRPAKVSPIEPPTIWPRNPPIRYRRNVPDRWLTVTLIEGRNRQVRRMTAAVGHPTLRLIRWRIGRLTLDGLAPGEWLEVDPTKSRPPTDVRPTGNDHAIRLSPPRVMTLEQAIACIDGDAMVEVTPKSVGLRKAILDPHERKNASRRVEE